MVTFLLGALAGAGQLLVAGGTGIAVAVLLVAKPRLEGFSRPLMPVWATPTTAHASPGDSDCEERSCDQEVI